MVVRVAALMALIVIPLLTGISLNLITSGEGTFDQVSALFSGIARRGLYTWA
jgi:hypothetical protein